MGSLAGQPDWIEAEVNLAVDDHTRHHKYFQVQRTEAQRRASLHGSDQGGASVAVKQKILNGRGVPSLTLDDASFELVRVPTALDTQDFYKMADGAEDLMAQYYEELETFVKSKLGCDEVVCIHHGVRNSKRSEEKGVATYTSGRPHTDSCGVSGDAIALGISETLAQKAGGGCSDKVSFQRYSFVNLWRNISDEPIQNDHLALLDERSVAKPDDYVVRDLLLPDHHMVQYALNARHASHHRWYYFPHMTKDEALLFKHTDSDFTKSGRSCFHMSVTDPAAPADAKPRESIEVRMLCFWKRAGIDTMPTRENVFAEHQKDVWALAQRGPQLRDATALQLIGQLFTRIFCGAGRPQEARSQYSGRPEDYLAKFTAAVAAFPNWPAVAKTWARATILQRGPDEGIRAIVSTIVKDSTGRMGTRNFSSAEQQAIADHLLSNTDFMLRARANFVKA